MQSHAGIGKRLRRFNRKYGLMMFVVLIAGVVVALVGLLMWVLTSSEWRVRW